MPNFSHDRIISRRNSVNNTTTMVIPLGAINAGNWNTKLLPSPVGMTTMIRGRPCTMALIALFCMPRNCASFFNIRRNSCSILAERNNTFRAWRCCWTIACHGDSISFLFLLGLVSYASEWSSADANPNYKCYIRLAVRNLSRLLATEPFISSINRAYMEPATCDVWPAC